MEENVVLSGSPVQDSTPSQPTDTTDWQGKYHATSSQLGRLKKELDEYKAKYATALGELEAFRADTNNAIESLKKTLAERENALAETNGRLKRLERQQQLGATIMKEYPELMPLHAKGLVNPDGLEDEALTTYLKDLAETVTSISSQQRQQQMQGTTPPPPKPDSDMGKMSLEDIEKKLGIINPRSPEWKQLSEMRDRLIFK